MKIERTSKPRQKSATQSMSSNKSSWVSRRVDVRLSRYTERVWRRWWLWHGLTLGYRCYERTCRVLVCSETPLDQRSPVHAVPSSCDLPARWTLFCSYNAAVTPTDVWSAPLHHWTRGRRTDDSTCWRRRWQAEMHEPCYYSSTATTRRQHKYTTNTAEQLTPQTVKKWFRMRTR